MNSSKLRESFLSFFEKRGHKRLASFSLIPVGDPSLLLINAGMAPLKPYFAGKEKPPAPRLTSCQKCVRTVDIEKVGTTPFHLTFFEMLGNFSFGDYFKEEAIALSWEFMTQVLGLKKERLAVSVHRKDPEAERIWRAQPGFDRPIYKLGDEHNFWAAGETGPCGYDTEIYFDLEGAEFPQQAEEFVRLSDAGRYIEVWNLVFMEFDRDEEGKLTPLPQKNVDTGMGLERMAVCLQGKGSVFETDLFQPLMEVLAGRGIPAQPRGGVVPAHLIADHARAAVMLMADGVIPSNEGRGYVLRKIIRRAVKTAFREGVREPMLVSLLGPIGDTLSAAYPEIERQEKLIRGYLEREEEQFLNILERSYHQVMELIGEARQAGRPVDGRKLFVLHDTYGFPFDLAEELAAEAGVEVDRQAFEEAMAEQRERARRAAEFTGEALRQAEVTAEAEFVGYERLSATARVRQVSRDDGHLLVATDLTPFYATGGGQPGDTGLMRVEGVELSVVDTPLPGVHVVEPPDGELAEKLLAPGVEVELEVDRRRREALMRAHTATHLLHKALRTVLGEHVTQQGSQLHEDRLRFDFNHFEALSDEEVAEVERLINRWIVEDRPVRWEFLPKEEALSRGAIALFGEKYGEIVRIVEVEGVSVEFCGGTHVSRTSQIGLALVVAEESIASGTRRIEMVVGHEAWQLALEQKHLITRLSRHFKAEPGEIEQRIAELEERLSQTEERLRSLRRRELVRLAEELAERAINVNGVRLVVAEVPGVERRELGELADRVAAKLRDPLVVLGSPVGEGVAVVAKVSQRPIELGYQAGDLVREVAKACGGGGGGRPDFATAGGRDQKKLAPALDELRQRLVSELTKLISE